MPTDAAGTIAVVGASARAAAFSLLRAGRQVVAADLFADADLARQCPATRITSYPKGFEAWLAGTECDGWLYTGALENHPTLIDRLSVLRPLLGHAGNPLRCVRDPMLLQVALRNAGLYFPETKPGSAGQPRASAWLGKTYRGSSGSGVGVTDEAMFWQRHINGTSLSAVYRGNKLLGVTRQLVGETWAGAAEFKYCGSIGPWQLPKESQQHLQQLGEVLSTEFGLTHLYGVDLIFDSERIWTIEVNPRYTAAVETVERANGISIFGSTESPQTNACYGKVVLFAKAPLTVTAAMSTQLLEEAGTLPWPQLADIPRSGSEISSGQPILTLFVEADTCEKAVERLQQRVIDMERQLYGRTL